MINCMYMANAFFITIELIPDLEQGGFTARVPDVPAYGEGETKEEAIQDLKEALKGYAEAFGVADLQKRLSVVSEVRREEFDLQGLTYG